jgi:microcystin-dependent protein
MGTPYLGEIRVFAFNYPPKGWAFCNGQTMAINQNQALFALLGTTYGGNGTTTFLLPNFQGNSAISEGTSPGGHTYNLGGTGGEYFHALTVNEMPQHSHPLLAASANGSLASPVNNYPAAATANPYGSPGTSLTTLGTSSSPAGSSQPHENRFPFLVLNICIALAGIFPPRN